jgi:ComF family protein
LRNTNHVQIFKSPNFQIENMHLLQSIYHGLSHLFFPRLCEGCSSPLQTDEQVLCLQCLAQLPRTNSHHIADNPAALRLAGRFPFQHATTFAYFTAEGLLQVLLHGLKYHNKKEIGLFLGRQLGYDLQHSTWPQEIDLIIPVPLHEKKQAARGFNQSALIARGLGEVLQKPVDEYVLCRSRHTQSQTKKNRAERILNVEGAFSLQNDLTGKHLLLIDDVLTTGSTIEACATCLLAKGNNKVSVATIAIASD